MNTMMEEACMACTLLLLLLVLLMMMLMEGKGKRPFVGLTALLPCGILYSYPNEFLHSSPEALHTPSGVRDLC
jgi:hypothetical protein